MEQKYHVTAEELDSTRRKLESAWLRNQKLELELKAALSSRAVAQQPVPRTMSMKKLAVTPSVEHLSEEEEETDGDDEDDDSSEDSSSDASQEIDEARRSARELKLLEVKLKAVRDKQMSALKERRTLKQELSKKQTELKAEKKKYKILQKEVDKMAKLMRDTDDDDDEEDDEDEQDEDESEEVSILVLYTYHQPENLSSSAMSSQCRSLCSPYPWTRHFETLITANYNNNVSCNQYVCF